MLTQGGVCETAPCLHTREYRQQCVYVLLRACSHTALLGMHRHWYYVAIVMDFILRFLWTFSLVPKSMLPPAVQSHFGVYIRKRRHPTAQQQRAAGSFLLILLPPSYIVL